jgi:hypothetical protein
MRNMRHVASLFAFGALLAGCGTSHKAERPARVVGLAFYDFENDLAEASLPGNRRPQPFRSRTKLSSRAPASDQVHCAPGICFSGIGWYAFVRGPELTGADVVPSSVRAATDSSTGAAVVTMQFTPRGQRRFHAITAAEAHRGRRAQSTNPRAVQHFAIVVRGEILALPYVDPKRFPAGLPGENGIEIGGLPSKTAAERLVRELVSR